MPFTTEADIDIAVSPAVAFDTLADHASWPSWMPKDFFPVGPSLGVLSVGATPRVRISGNPIASKLTVSVVERARQIAWVGGVKGLMFAEHSFFFDPIASGTKVRSVEVWSGLLSGLVRPLFAPTATRVGKAQLDGLRKAAEARAG